MGRLNPEECWENEAMMYISYGESDSTGLQNIFNPDSRSAKVTVGRTYRVYLRCWQEMTPSGFSWEARNRMLERSLYKESEVDRTFEKPQEEAQGGHRQREGPGR